ncbi:MAG: STAS-like domain-containing protein [Calothrix sp. FI2-JRJ7]|nr:STAS-like domain-containing protein [Calothrix sp. FI2-JRJ7]
MPRFHSVNIFTSCFLNIAIGQLLKDIAREKLHELVKFAELSQDDQKLLAHVITNAERYYSDEEYRNAVDIVMSQRASEL